MEQRILNVDAGYEAMDQYWKESGTKHLLLVCGASLQHTPLDACFAALPKRLGIAVTRFSGFQPNPEYASVVEGVRVFQNRGCDAIAAAGGGSAIDVAKCIRLWCRADMRKNLLEQTDAFDAIPFLAVPTTAGSGSEATRFAAIYHQGKKMSIAQEGCRPSAVCFVPEALNTLPAYHRKAAMLDALCHGIESCWSLRATQESRAYARQAIQKIMESYEGYIQNQADGVTQTDCNAAMLQAAHLAGKAIDIAQTTAGHAMSYQLTRRYGVAHGHAVALCVAWLWPHLLEHTQRCTDSRSRTHLDCGLQDIAQAMGCPSARQAAERFRCILESLQLGVPSVGEAAIDDLVASVAPERLNNYPILLSSAELAKLYRDILHLRQTNATKGGSGNAADCQL